MKSMIAAAAATAFALGCAVAPPGRAAECELRKIGDMTIDMSHGVPRVPIDANGQRRWLIVDTTKAFSTLYAADILALGGVRLPNAQLQGLDRNLAKHKFDRYRLEKLVLGEAFHQERLYVIAPEDAQGSGEIAGFIGADVLTQSDVEFDLANNRITFFNAKNCDRSKPSNWIAPTGEAELLRPMDGLVQHFFHPLVTLNGHPAHAMLDTTTAFSAVDVTIAKDPGLASDNGGVQVAVSPQRMSTAKFATFGIGDETITNPTFRAIPMTTSLEELAVRQDPRDKINPSPSVVLGLDFLRAHRVLVAPSQNKLYVNYTGGPVFKTPPAPQVPK